MKNEDVYKALHYVDELSELYRAYVPKDFFLNLSTDIALKDEKAKIRIAHLKSVLLSEGTNVWNFGKVIYLERLFGERLDSLVGR